MKELFAAWVQRRIKEYGFEDGADFYRRSEKTGGRPRINYLLTIDMAKELAMVERTDIGRETRRYFSPQRVKTGSQAACQNPQKTVPRLIGPHSRG